MEIRLSRYNQPFTEPSTPDVHYISLDDQRDMRAGFFDAHIHAFNALPKTRVLELVDPLTGATFTHDMSGAGFFRPFNSQPTVVRSNVDVDFVAELQAAGVKVAGALLSSCTCRRPWRCTCKK